jgi:hypothetical protein
LRSLLPGESGSAEESRLLKREKIRGVSMPPRPLQSIPFLSRTP